MLKINLQNPFNEYLECKVCEEPYDYNEPIPKRCKNCDSILWSVKNNE